MTVTNPAMAGGTRNASAVAAKCPRRRRAERDPQEIRTQHQGKGVRRSARGERQNPVPDDLVRERDEAGKEREPERQAHDAIFRRRKAPSTHAATAKFTPAASLTAPSCPR